jgi:hypothetical protein
VRDIDIHLMYFSLTEVCSISCSDEWWSMALDVLKATNDADLWHVYFYGA